MLLISRNYCQSRVAVNNNRKLGRKIWCHAEHDEMCPSGIYGSMQREQQQQQQKRMVGGKMQSRLVV